VHDSKEFIPLVREAMNNINNKRISRVIANGSYDSIENFNLLSANNIDLVIKVR
jgi:hypothetical protein